MKILECQRNIKLTSPISIEKEKRKFEMTLITPKNNNNKKIFYFQRNEIIFTIV